MNLTGRLGGRPVMAPLPGWTFGEPRRPGAAYLTRPRRLDARPKAEVPANGSGAMVVRYESGACPIVGHRQVRLGRGMFRAE